MPRPSSLRWLALGLGLLVKVAGADEGEQSPPLDEIPVPEAGSDEPPPVSDFEWYIVGNVQGDGLIATSVDEADRESLILRRARLSVIADWRFDWRLQISGDLGKYHGLRDAFVEYRGLPIYIAAGRMVEPFGLLQGGASGAAFMERPQPMMLAPGYGEGIAANMAGDSWGFTAGAFNATQNEIDLGRREEDSFTGRLTWAPFRTETALLHLGAAGSWRDSGDGLQRFEAAPETTLIHDLNTRSGVVEANSSSPGSNAYWLYGGELAWKLGSVLFQGEYIYLTFDDVNTSGPGGGLVRISSPVFQGYYVEASWALTGEQRDYSVRRGAFGNIYPQEGGGRWNVGAIEFAARYSDTNLRVDLPYHGPFGDRGSVASLGLNWYPTDSLKVMLEGLQIERLSETNGVSEETRQWLVQGRLQWYFGWP